VGRLICTTTMTVDAVTDVGDWFWLHPAIQGEGARPFESATAPMRLLDVTSFDSGVTLLRYEPVCA
jgi:hypothetical protein